MLDLVRTSKGLNWTDDTFKGYLGGTMPKLGVTSLSEAWDRDAKMAWRQNRRIDFNSPVV